jgi:hypothetical protein
MSYAAVRRYVDTLADRAADRLDAFNRAVNPVKLGVVDTGLQAEVDAMLRPALERHLDAVRAEFWTNDEYVHVPSGLPPELVERIRSELDLSKATRSFGIWHRAAGSIGYRRIQAEAPVTAAVYRSQAMLDYLSALTGKRIYCRDDADDHACTFYVYTRPGDHMGFHHDICGCEDGAAYSMIIGVIDDSTQQLLVELRHGDPVRARSLRVSTPPGTLISFSGSKLLHGVSKLGRNERRVTLGLAYVTTTFRPPVRKLVKVTADTLFHFGIAGWVERAKRRLGSRRRGEVAEQLAPRA